jgi:hypothetical protein
VCACGGFDPGKDVVPPISAGASRFLMVALRPELLPSGRQPYGLRLLALDPVTAARATPPRRATGLGRWASTRVLLYDPDGSGDQDADQFATLAPATALVASRIWAG